MTKLFLAFQALLAAGGSFAQLWLEHLGAGRPCKSGSCCTEPTPKLLPTAGRAPSRSPMVWGHFGWPRAEQSTGLSLAIARLPLWKPEAGTSVGSSQPLPRLGRWGVGLGRLLQGSPASSFCCQDVDDRWSLQFPQLYVPGQQNLYFNKREFAKCILYSIYSSLVLFLVPYGTIFDSVRNDGRGVADYQSFALMVQTCLLIVVSVQVGGSVSPTAAVLCPPQALSPEVRLWPRPPHGPLSSELSESGAPV